MEEQTISIQDLQVQLEDTKNQLYALEQIQDDNGDYDELKQTFTEAIHAIQEALLLYHQHSTISESENSQDKFDYTNSSGAYNHINSENYDPVLAHYTTHTFKDTTNAYDESSSTTSIRDTQTAYQAPKRTGYNLYQYPNQTTDQTGHAPNRSQSFDTSKSVNKIKSENEIPIYSFPKRNLNGSVTWHLGHIINLDNQIYNDTLNEEDERKVLMMYITPQNIREKICNFVYTNRDCPYGHKCRFHHGTPIPLSLVNKFKWDLVNDLIIQNSVLARYSDGFWYKGILLEQIESESSIGKSAYDKNSTKFRVKFDEPYNHEHIVDENSIYPCLDNEGFITKVYPESTNNKSQSFSNQNSDQESSNDTQESKTIEDEEYRVFKEKLLNTNKADEFGSWMKHTNGFGLKMALKMGYKMGNPLGPIDRPSELGPALVIPVPIKIIPAGRSLDFINTEMKKKKKRGSGKMKLISQYGYEAFETMENVKSQGLFKLMNNGLLKTLTDIKDNTEKDEHKDKSKHLHSLSELRKSKIPEAEIRKRLFNIDNKLKELQQELQYNQNNLNRHIANQKSRSKEVASTYMGNCSSLEAQVAKLQDERTILNQKLENNKAKQKLRIF